MIRLEINDMYVAGMWFKRLAQQLMWQRDRGPAVRSPGYCALSWLWASIEGSMSPYWDRFGSSDQDQSTVTVEDIHLDYTTDDDTGQLCGGWLDLTSIMRPVTLLWDVSARSSPWALVLGNPGTMKEHIGSEPVLDDASVGKETILRRSAERQYLGMLCQARRQGLERGRDTDDRDIYYSTYLLLL